jgi:thiol-disulfide isomerase/thioredoxin
MDSAPETENQAAARVRNGIVALAAVMVAGLVFFAARASGPSLAKMAETAVPLEVALASGKPTLVEFYTDTCTVCQAMAPTVEALEERYGDRVNFVMLNAHNPRWLPELERFKVDGVPVYAFLDNRNRPLGKMEGLQSEVDLEANLTALADGKTALPKLDVRAGRTTGIELPQREIQPRDHS